MARPKVILFDVNETLLNLQPMKEAITKLLGGGPETARLWFTTLLQHSTLMPSRWKRGMIWSSEKPKLSAGGRDANGRGNAADTDGCNLT
ncbi:MAG TPA: hypothetical protein VN688_09970 [Gemmataceae bacterium]|nr:hypothetical protein [Gemmataceae bacterium]